jgi:uncharacterized protein YdcH (DUF465 family)
MSEKLLYLKSYMARAGLFEETYRLGKIIYASEERKENAYNRGIGIPDTIPMTPKKREISTTDATVALGPGRKWTSPSEPKLLQSDIKPIRYIAGTEAEKRGEGIASAEGNVYEVEYKGMVAVAKVLTGSSPAEPENWKKIMDIKKALPKEQARHLPEIYDIIKPDFFTTIIVMELLKEPGPHIKKILRSKEGRGRSEVMKNDDFIFEALTSAFNVIDDYNYDPEDSKGGEIYAMIKEERVRLKDDIEGSILKSLIKPEEISEEIQNFFSNYIARFDLGDSNLLKTIADKIQEKFIKYINSSHRPVAKYFSPKGIDNTLQHLVLSTDRDQRSDEEYGKRIDLLTKERKDSVYSESPESFLYTEKYMPETRSFFSMLSSLNDYGIEWSDVHANNIMERIGSRELVLIDVGLFE